MGKRHEKGLIWVVFIIGVCALLMYALKNYTPKSVIVDEANTNSVDILNDISLKDTTEATLYNSEQEDLWILLDQLLFDHEQSPVKTILFSAALILYIIIIGPIGYFWLKKQDKMEWMWIVIPVASIVFAGIIVVMGDGLAIREPVIDSLTVISPGENDVVYMCSTSPGRNAYSISFTEDVTNVIPLYINGEYELYNDSLIQNEKRYNIVEEQAQTLAIEFEPGEAFSNDYIRLNLDCTHSSKINMNGMKQEGDVFVGTFSNSTKWDFANVLLCYGEKYCVIKMLEKDDFVTVEKEDWKTIEDVWSGPSTRELSAKGDYAKILSIAYLKYFEVDSGASKGLQIAAVIPRYDSDVIENSSDVVSHGLYYQEIK